MLKHLKRAKDKVEHLMEKYPATRDDDKLLWLAYLVVFCDLKNHIGDDAYKRLKDVVMSPDTCTMASVIRVRRKIQADGRLLGSSDVMARRKKDSEEVHDFFKNSDKA